MLGRVRRTPRRTGRPRPGSWGRVVHTPVGSRPPEGRTHFRAGGGVAGPIVVHHLRAAAGHAGTDAAAQKPASTGTCSRTRVAIARFRNRIQNRSVSRLLN